MRLRGSHTRGPNHAHLVTSRTLLGVILASSSAVRGTIFDDPDELQTAEVALGNEPDELDGGRALVLGLKRDDYPVNRGRMSRGDQEWNFRRWHIVVRRSLVHNERSESVPHENRILSVDPPKREVRTSRGFAWASYGEQVLRSHVI